MEDTILFNARLIAEHRRSGGTLGRGFAVPPVLLLTIGRRRTRRPNTMPLGHLINGIEFVVAASAGGSAWHRDLYGNLGRDWHAVLEVGSERLVATASVVSRNRRPELFDRLCSRLPDLSGYAATVEREIPVFAPTPMSSKPGLAAASDRLPALHRRGDPLVLVNAWHAVTATRGFAAGGRAVATSSAALALSLGLPDEASAPASPIFEGVRRTSGAVEHPVSAYVLDVFGLDMVELVLSAGAVGPNLEDSDHAGPGSQVCAEDFANRVPAVWGRCGRRLGPQRLNRIQPPPRSQGHRRPPRPGRCPPGGRRRLRLPRAAHRPADRQRTRHPARRPVNANAGSADRVAAITKAEASQLSVRPMAIHTAFDALTADMVGTNDGESQ